VGLYGYLCMAVLEAVEGGFGLFESLLATGLPARSDTRSLTCRSRTDFRFGWRANAEHRRFMTEPLPSRHSPRPERILGDTLRLTEPP